MQKIDLSNARVLIVDDTPQNIQLLGAALKDEGFQINVAMNGEKALQIAQRVLPDLILLDITMTEMDGFEVCGKLKKLDEMEGIPIIFLTARNEIEDIVKGFEVGAVDYIIKPFNLTELKARVKTHLTLKFALEELKRKNQELERIVVIDSLTQIYNRHFIMDRLSEEMAESLRFKQPLSILILDIDLFKQINDNYGHLVGDEVLKIVAQTIRQTVRENDIPARYGGEEFLVVFPRTDLEQCRVVAEKIRGNIQNLKWKQPGMKLTISGGTSQLNQNKLNVFIDQADQLLYKAKNNGRNRIE